MYKLFPDNALVVFSGDAQFKTDIPKNVIHIEGLISFIDAMRYGTISENRVHFCVGRLECKRFELTSQTDVQHQAYLEQKFGETHGPWSSSNK